MTDTPKKSSGASKRLQIVRGDAGWFTRLWSGSRETWRSSQVYARKPSARKAIEGMPGFSRFSAAGDGAYFGKQLVGVEELDERTPPLAAPVGAVAVPAGATGLPVASEPA